MISLLNEISQSNLKIFLRESYSLELLFRIDANVSDFGIEEIYDSIISCKPKKATFDRYIKQLILEGYLIVKVPKDRRKRTMELSKDVKISFENILRRWEPIAEK
jgi:hypothetical protein